MNEKLEQTEQKEIGEMLEHIVANMATKDDLSEIRAEMATKDDIAKIREEMVTKDDLFKLEQDLRKEIRENREAINNLSGFSKEIDMLITRVSAVEQHLGIVPSNMLALEGDE